ncbi:MAG TPA: hypothetical protein VGG38_11865 [Acidimicrobiales bacterium]
MLLATGAAGGCPGLDAINPVCQVGSAVGGLAGDGIDAVLNGLSQWVASGAEWLLSQIGQVINSTTTVDLNAAWFHQHYGTMTGLAAVLALPLLIVSSIQAIFRQSAAQLIRSFLIQLPLALLLGVIAVQIVALCLAATDAMCAAVAGGTGSDVTSMLSSISQGLVLAAGDPSLATFVLLLVAMLVAAAAFVLWLELLIRAAAVYVAALFLPLALVTLVWPSISHWCRRLIETLAALILSKFVIVATLSLAAGAVTSGSGFAAVLAGAALLVLATFTPFVILRLIPMAEAGAIGHLEGARQRATAAVTRVPRSAANFALSEGFEALGAHRVMAHAAASGALGQSNGAAASAAGGAGGGGGGVATAAAGSEEGSMYEDETGLTPDETGMARGVGSGPGSWDALSTRLDEMAARPRGRAPIVGWSEGTGDDGKASNGAGPSWPKNFVGWYGPRTMERGRHYIGNDGHGPQIGFIRTEDIPPGEPPRSPGRWPGTNGSATS